MAQFALYRWQRVAEPEVAELGERDLMQAVWQDQTASARTTGLAEAVEQKAVFVGSGTITTSASIYAVMATAGAAQTLVAEFDRVRAAVMRGRVFHRDSADVVRQARDERTDQL